jgi:uncharacterized membrane protein YfcA
MAMRFVLDRRSGATRTLAAREIIPRPLGTVGIGIIGGLVVGMTSVGSGSLMIVLMLCLYPRLRAGSLVGTDLTQAVPLTLAAAIGALIFGHVVFGVTASAVIVGSMISSRVPDRYIRPVIALVIFASGLKYAGLGSTTLGWVLCAVVLACGAAWMATTRPWRAAEPDLRRVARGDASI